MLTAQGCAGRRERLWNALPAPCDVLVVGDAAHVNYFAGYHPSPFVFRTAESAGALLLVTPGRSALVADDMMGPFLEQALVDEHVAPMWYDGQHSAPYRRGVLVPAAVDRIGSIPGRRLGIELAAVPAAFVEALRTARPGLEIVDIGPIIWKMRRAKDPDEIDLMRRSIRAGEAGLAAAHQQVKPGMTEIDVFLIVQNAAIQELGEPAILYGDFASGPRPEREARRLTDRARDRARRPAPHRLLGGCRGLSWRLYQYVRGGLGAECRPAQTL